MPDSTNGYLELLVQGLFRKSWQARWIVYLPQEQMVNIYENANQWISTYKPKEKIHLKTTAVTVLSNPFRDRQFVFHIRLGNTKSHYLSAKGLDNFLKWKNVFIKKADTTDNSVASDSVISSTCDDDTSNTTKSLHDSTESLKIDESLYENTELHSTNEESSSCIPTIVIQCSMYEVSVRDTEDATRLLIPKCPLFLCVSECGVSLSVKHSTDHSTVMYQWPFVSMKSYGRSAESFSFQAGRRCGDLAGLFSFRTECGEEIFTEIMSHTQRISQLRQQSSAQMDNNPLTGNVSPSPTSSESSDVQEESGYANVYVLKTNTSTIEEQSTVDDFKATENLQDDTNNEHEMSRVTHDTNDDDDLSNYDSADNVRAALEKLRQKQQQIVITEEQKPTEDATHEKENVTNSLPLTKLTIADPQNVVSVNVAAMKAMFEKNVHVPPENYENVRHHYTTDKNKPRGSHYDHLTRRDLMCTSPHSSPHSSPLSPPLKWELAVASNYALMHRQTK